MTHNKRQKVRELLNAMLYRVALRYQRNWEKVKHLKGEERRREFRRLVNLSDSQATDREDL